MAFWGNTFIFDGIPSETFNLYISSPDSGMVQTTGAGDVQFITQQVFRRPKPYLLGVQPSPTLTFDVQFTSPTELMAEDIQIIQKWLFGQTGYKKLQIIQEDMQNVYFNCYLSAPKIIRTGNLIFGVAATVNCDAPYGYEFPKTVTRTYSEEFDIVADTIEIFNTSDNAYYEYPHVSFQINHFDGICKITNQSDNNRLFRFIDLLPSEKVDVNNELCIITSDSGLRRLANFNKGWLRLRKGLNRLYLEGNVANVTITYSPARKMA